MATNVLLSVHPDELTITALSNTTHLDSAVTTLQLSNVSFKPVMYRLKTTAPNRYVVKPSKGVVRSNGTETIHIHLAEVLGAQNLKDEFRLEFAAVEDGDNVGSKYEHLADVLAAKSSRNGKYKKDISCVVLVQEVKPSSPAVVKKAQPRAPLSPHAAPSTTVIPPSTAVSDDGAIPQNVGFESTRFGAQPLEGVPQFEIQKQRQPSPAGHPVTKPDEPLQRSPVPAAGASKGTAPPQREFTDDRTTTQKRQTVAQQASSSVPLYCVIALAAVAVAFLWTLR